MKFRLKSSILAGISALMLLTPQWRQSTLTDIAKPHLGMYECKRATLGSLDCLERFSYITLELKTEEDFLLCYKEKGGNRQQTQGKYRYDQTTGNLTLIEENGTERAFPLANGVLTVTYPIGGKMLVIQFQQK